MSDKTRAKSRVRDQAWFEQNPPDTAGLWQCYLRIHPKCPRLLNRQDLLLEHVQSKVRRPELKFAVDNLRPACGYCNKLKGSQSIDDLIAKGHLHLQA